MRAMKLGKQTQDTLFILHYDAFGRITSKLIKTESYGNFNYTYWYSEDKKQFASISSNNNQHGILLHRKDDQGHITSSSTYNGGQYRIR